MFIMSEISTTAFTEQLNNTKSSLDNFFKIPIREEAVGIIKEMIKVNNNTNAASLGDLDSKLLEILKNDINYVKNNSEILLDGREKVNSLFKNGFKDIKKNTEVILNYAEYVKRLKGVKDLDELFLEKLNIVYSHYKSSADYMGRLVNRLLKYKFNYTDEMLRGVGTRVLILRHFLNVYGYDCVEEISSPELEDVVKNEFEGKIENITDDIFRYLDGTEKKSEYDKEYIDALVELQGTILYKSSTIQVTKELCEELCTLIHDETTLVVKNKKTNQVKYIPKKVLTDFAKDGTATLLKDCFYEPETFLVNYIKSYKAADINKIVAFTQKLNRLYAKGKKEDLESFSNIDESIRLGILFSKFLEKIGSSEEMLMLFSIAFPNIVLQRGNCLEECITEEGLKTIKCIKQSNIIKNKEQLDKIRNLLAEGEKCLEAEDRKQYQSLLYKKIGERYNGATNPSKKDSLYKKINELLDIKRTEYRMLKVVDDLANARFSSQGKTREYIYIFAIAFEMTYGTEDTDLQKELYKEDPRSTEYLTDIEKNLFFDYYSDNIVNNYRRIAGLEDGSSTDIMIDGHGINYKNFSEIAFLWCLNRNVSSAEKLKTAYEIIRYCKENGKNIDEFYKTDLHNKSKDVLTQVYRDKYRSANIITVDQIKTFLINNFPCRFEGNITRINEENRTAKEFQRKLEAVINRFMTAIEDSLLLDDENEFSSDELRQKRIEMLTADLKTDIEYYFKLNMYLQENRCKNCCRSKKTHFPLCPEYFNPYGENEKRINSCEDYYTRYKNSSKSADEEKEFKKEVSKIVDGFVGQRQHFKRSFSNICDLCSEDQKDLKKLLIKIKKRVVSDDKNEIHFESASRTAVMSLCYYLMILMNWKNREEDIIIHKFEDYFNMFCNGRSFVVETEFEEFDWYELKNVPEIVVLNELKDNYLEIKFLGANSLLKQCGYQKVNSKNILDICLIFLAYKDNYKQIYSSEEEAVISYYLTMKKYLNDKEKEIEENRKNKNNISKDR